jgi:hypothetical protein
LAVSCTILILRVGGWQSMVFLLVISGCTQVRCVKQVDIYFESARVFAHTANCGKCPLSVIYF